MEDKCEADLERLATWGVGFVGQDFGELSRVAVLVIESWRAERWRLEYWPDFPLTKLFMER
jgi:hypothetical protein